MPALSIVALLTLAAAPGPDLKGMDTAVAPGADFFAFANGGWVKATEIPADRARWGVGAMTAKLTRPRTADSLH